jgi:acyl-CoA synthetase (AMP-forming)/AMP-acid ligase II
MPASTDQSSEELQQDFSAARIEACTLGDLLLKGADRWPDRIATVFGDERSSYAQLAGRALTLARGLQAVGVRRGDHVGILMPNRPDFVETFFAVALCGAVGVLINARYRASELAYVVENADLVTVVTTGAVADGLDFSQRLREALPELDTAQDPLALQLGSAPRLRNVILLGDARVSSCIDEARLLAMAETVPLNVLHAARIAVRVRDVGMILYTSGTSSRPKGCLISHEAIVRNSMNLGRERWCYGAAERVWSPLPLFHIAAMLALLSSVDLGGTFIGHDRFDPGECLRVIESCGANTLFLPFVTFLQEIAQHPDFSSTDFSQVRLMNSCFAAMPPSVGEAYRAVMPHVIQVGTMGMTEACGVVTTGGPAMDLDMGFSRLGYPLPGVEVLIVDREDGSPLDVGETGEVLVRGYSLFEGYYRDLAKTVEALPGDGWYHTGDLGSLDAAGHLMFHGRLKDMFKVGGENVSAAEVEAVLARHSSVRLAQAIGIPDVRLSEVVAAFVERSGEESADEAALIAFCRGQMASFKVPRHIRFVDAWPMSASKIQKFELRARLVQELGLGDA